MSATEKRGREAPLGFRRGDAVAAAAVLLCALALAAGLFFAAPGGGPTTVQVYRQGALVWEHPLAQDGEYRVSGLYENIVTVRGGQVSITESTCRGGDCLRMGPVGAAGQSIVCLPNRVEVRLVGGAGHVDAIVR